MYPAQSALLPRIVDRVVLAAANSRMAMAFIGVDMAFNALGELLIAIIGAVALFVVDSITFAVAFLLFAGIQVPPAGRSADENNEQEDVLIKPGRPKEGFIAPDPADDGEVDLADAGLTAESNYGDSLREGVLVLRGSPVLIALILTTLVSNFVYGGVFAILPAYADVRGGPAHYGASSRHSPRASSGAP